MGSIYQSCADVIFESASNRLGRQVAAPRVLHAFDDEPESVPVASQPPPAASATEAASLTGAGELSPPTHPSAPALP